MANNIRKGTASALKCGAALNIIGGVHNLMQGKNQPIENNGGNAFALQFVELAHSSLYYCSTSLSEQDFEDSGESLSS